MTRVHRGVHMIEVVLPMDLRPRLSAGDKKALATIAYLSIAEDGKIGEEELSAYLDVLTALYGGQEDIYELARRQVGAHYMSGELIEEQLAERLRAAVEAMSSRHVRKVSFELAYALCLGDDLTVDEEEYKLVETLREILELSSEAASAMEDQVVMALSAER